MRRIRIILLLVVFVALVAFAAISAIHSRVRATAVLRDETNRQAVPSVVVVRPQRGAPAEEVILPGNIQAFIDSPIYARASGYLRHWYFDIGAHVKEGDLLADIESPEIDQQLQQARADLATAEANLKLAQITAARYQDLFKTDSVSKQDVDNAVQDAAAKTAAVKSGQANVGRLEQLVSFEKVYAPFDGVITARNTDIGQLIDSGSSGGPARELFHIAAIYKLRVFVNVPQVYSHATVRGMKADLTFPELPGKRFTGTLVRTADAIDPATRTLLVEVDVANPTGQLLPGAYTEVHFAIRSNRSTLIIPSASLIFRSDVVRVAIVEGNHAKLVPVIVGRDFGNTIEILSGLSDTSALIPNPPDSIIDGEAVRVIQPKATSSEP